MAGVRGHCFDIANLFLFVSMKALVLCFFACTAHAADVCDEASPAIGVLGLDGYYWPTQPGDVSDLRTWCPTLGTDGDKYTCKFGSDEKGNLHFDVVHATVDGATWTRVQAGETEGLREGFKNALSKLLSDPKVCGIVGHAGFFGFYQTFVENIVDDILKVTETSAKDNDGNVEISRRLGESKPMRKPILLGTPLLTVPFTKSSGQDQLSSWKLLEDDDEKVLIVTSNYPRLTRKEVEKMLLRWADRYALDDSVKAKWAKDNAEKTFSLGWNNMPGYGIAVVYGALFHNVHNVLSHFKTQMKAALHNATKMGVKIRGIIMESTEMAMHSNSIRKSTGLPVWDISTLGKCLVVMGMTKSFDQGKREISQGLFNNTDFKRCMMGWYNASRYETLFGEQTDGKLKHYDDNGLNKTQLEKIHCSGGRDGTTPIGRKMEDFPTFKDIHVTKACYETEKYCLCDGCSTKCPGGGNCGEKSSPCGVRGEKEDDPKCKDANSIDHAKNQCPSRGKESNLIPSDCTQLGSIAFFVLSLRAMLFT